MRITAAPRIKPTKPGSKYRYKLVYPNGYVKYVRWPEQLPKEVSNPRDKERLEKLQTARELLQIARSVL
jgi:hypothetical protein